MGWVGHVGDVIKICDGDEAYDEQRELTYLRIKTFLVEFLHVS